MKNLTTSKPTPQQAQIEFFQRIHEGGYLKEEAGLKIYQYVKIDRKTGEEKPYMAIWRGRQKAPFYHYRMRNLVEMFAEVKRIVASEIEIDSWKANRRKEASKKLAEIKDSLKVGDIYYTSVSYSMTQVNFYEVVRIEKNRAYFRQLCVNATGQGVGYKTPIKGEYYGGKEYSCQISAGMKFDGGRESSKWDGKPKYYNSFD